MDAFDIALLMANQHADSPVRMRYGTVVGACDESVLSVVPDGQESPVPAVKCCLPAEGSRVVLLVNGTEWIAVSVVGGDCPYGVGDVLTTFSDADPHERWRGTTWEQLHDRMLLASGKRGVGEAGGEEEHVNCQSIHMRSTWHGEVAREQDLITSSILAAEMFPVGRPGSRVLAAACLTSLTTTCRPTS